MPLTTNWDIYYRDTSTPASLETESATQATSIEDALNAIVANREIQTYKWANSTERSSQIGMTGGDIGFQADTGITYRYDGSAWVLVSRPQVLVTRVTSQTLASGSTVAAIFTAHPIMDTGFTHDTATNATRVTVANAGTYVADLEVTWDSSSAGTRRLQIAVNGTSRALAWDTPPGGGAFPQSATTPSLVLAAGDYVEMTLVHTVGANLAITAAAMRLTRIA